MVKVSKNIIPSFFTILNMFFGFFAVIKASQGNLKTAVWLIFAGAVMDTLDGKIARLTNTSSDFGVEYDSLADVVTFGMSPSFVVYYAFFRDMGLLGLFIAFSPLLFGSLRLARFNIQLVGHVKNAFAGLPIPVAAVTVTSLIFFEDAVWGALTHDKLHLFVVLATSLLMVSTIRYPVFPPIKINRDPKQIFMMAYLAFSITLLFIIPYYSLFILSVVYVMVGLLGWVKGDRVYEKNVK